ncbi:MAG: hypothetical protein K2Q09_05460, partial [Phycisphaerales bacterium]|nr:hypothetical protein [Phycisphaerales bacterium]
TDATFAYLARPFAAQIWPTGDAAPGPWIGLSYEPAVFPPYFSTSGNRFTDQVDYFNDGGRPIPTEYSHAAAGPIVPAESHPSFMDSITWHFWTPEVTSEHVFLDAGECPSYTGREAVTHTVTCPGSSVTLTAPQPGRGISSQPFNYSWQVRLADGAWAPLADGPFSQPGVAAFTTSGASTRDLTLSNYTPPPIGAQPLTSFRAVVSSECGAQVALNTALESPALTVGTCRADLGRAGGVAGCDGRLDNNDFIVFIAYFFGADPAADMGQAGGLRGSDGRLDNNDFITFINLFFAGC